MPKNDTVVYSVAISTPTNTTKEFAERIREAIEAAEKDARPRWEDTKGSVVKHEAGVTTEAVNSALQNLVEDLKPHIDGLENAFLERKSDPFELSDYDKAIINFETNLRNASNNTLTNYTEPKEYYVKGLQELTDKNEKAFSNQEAGKGIFSGLRKAISPKRSSAEELLNAASMVMTERGVTTPKFEHILQAGKTGTLNDYATPPLETAKKPEPLSKSITQGRNTPDSIASSSQGESLSPNNSSLDDSFVARLARERGQTPSHSMPG